MIGAKAPMISSLANQNVERRLFFGSGACDSEKGGGEIDFYFDDSGWVARPPEKRFIIFYREI